VTETAEATIKQSKIHCRNLVTVRNLSSLVARISGTHTRLVSPVRPALGERSSRQSVVRCVVVMQPHSAGVEREYGRDAADNTTCAEDRDYKGK
jgi:hypothetical protein